MAVVTSESSILWPRKKETDHDFCHLLALLLHFMGN